MANNDLGKFLAGSGLNRVWEKVFSLVKILTGDVDVNNKGTLQKQIDDVRAIASGRKQGKVFATTDDMKTWLQNFANAGLLNIGDNLYIVEKDVPDWWISGVLTEVDSSTGYFYTIEPLEGPKIDLSSYDTALNKLNEDITTLNGKRKLIAIEFSTGAINVTNDKNHRIPYSVPSGYEFLAITDIHSNGIATSIAYQGKTNTELIVYVNTFGGINGGNGALLATILFQAI